MQVCKKKKKILGRNSRSANSNQHPFVLLTIKQKLMEHVEVERANLHKGGKMTNDFLSWTLSAYSDGFGRIYYTHQTSI